jgi:hypothetical protein
VWFRRRSGRNDLLSDLYISGEYPDGDFDLGTADSAETDFVTFTHEAEPAREAVAGTRHAAAQVLT